MAAIIHLSAGVRNVPASQRIAISLPITTALSVLCALSATTQAAKGPAPAAQADGLLQKCLAGPMKDVEDIVFAVRGINGDGHWYANFGYHVYSNANWQYGKPDGGQLCRLNLRTGKLTVLLDDPKGGVRDPAIHYDGNKILFSYRKGDSRQYHLYEINADGTGLRQITDGPYDDIEPIYLPDGDILFCSARCRRWVNCWFTQVAVLYRCDINGRNIHQISANIEQDNTPWMLPDGRVMYMRWEYVDRSRVQFHHLWTIYPDGTSQMILFGNQHGGIVMLDAKPIPNSHKVVASFSPGHGRKEHAGWVAVVDSEAGPDDRNFARNISRTNDYRDPYPFSEDCFLVALNNQLQVMDGQGNVQTVYELPAGSPYWIHEPRPLTPHAREAIIPSRVDWSKTTGTLILSDVTYGRNMQGVKPGEIKELLILETLPKQVNFSGEMDPLSLGGTFTLPRVLGTVPVEPDGSASIEVPALRPLYFAALDANGLAVKRMQSFVSVMPGETTSCSGCHEQRNRTAPNKPNLLAANRPPSKIQPITDTPDVFDFPRDIQPILDKYCIKCHNYETYTAGVVLAGDRGPWFSQSYATLMSRDLVSHGHDAGGNHAPRTLGSSASRLMRKIDGSHHDVKATPLETKTIRLWIECGAPYPGTYAALGTGMVNVEINKDIHARRCESCHAPAASVKKKAAPIKAHREQLFNLTRPEKSLALLAPLAKSSGGLGLCGARNSGGKDAGAGDEGAKSVGVFKDTSDADYQKLLAAIKKASEQLENIKRFDMPGFRPNEPYIREMKRFGILPEDADPSRPIDCYATDQAYWKLFWYSPDAK